MKGRRGAALTGAARRSAAAARHASPCPASPPAPCPRPARVRSPAVKQPIADVLPVKRASSGHLRSTLALPAARYGAHKTPTAHANQSDAHILAVPDAGLSLWTCAQAQRNMRAAPHSVSCQPPRCSAPPANSPPTTAQARPLPGARLGDRVAADRQAELQAAKAAAAGQRLAQRQHRERGPDHDLYRPDVVHVQAELRPPCARSQCAGCHTRCGARRRRPCTMPGRSACQCSLGLRVHARQSNHRDWTGGYAPQALAHVAWMQIHGSKWQFRAARMRYMQSVRDAEPGHMCEAGGSELGSRHAPCAAEAAGGRTLVRHPGHRVQREAHVHLRRRQVEALPQHEHLGRCAQCSEGLPLPQQLCAHTSRCKSQPSVLSPTLA